MGLFSKKPAEVIAEFDKRAYGCNALNSDGTSRASYVAKLKKGEDLFFKPAPTKEYPDTIGVFTKKGHQIGFLHYTFVNELRGTYRNNKASAIVAEVEGSGQGLSVLMRIKIYK